LVIGPSSAVPFKSGETVEMEPGHAVESMHVELEQTALSLRHPPALFPTQENPRRAFRDYGKRAKAAGILKQNCSNTSIYLIVQNCDRAI